MAEIAVIAGVTITIPAILNGAWTVLKAAYELYGSVDVRRSQIGILLECCQDLIAKIAQRLSADSEAALSPTIQTGVNDVQKTCQAVKDMLEKLKKKGFVWCMVNKDKIDNQILDVEVRVTVVFMAFDFVAHIDRDKFQQDMLSARQKDHTELVTKLDRLSSNDQQILDAIRDHGGVHRRQEELLVAILKHVEGLPAGMDRSPEAKFLRSAGNALQRRSKDHRQMIAENWVLSSLEVDFDATEKIGEGSFGRVFKGQWNGVRVAVKQMYTDDARTLSEKDRKEMYKEVKLWTALHHPNVLRLYGACLEASLPFLVMDYCPFGNLCNYLLNHPDANRVDLSYDVVAGMTHLHKRGIVHADLKGVNILVDQNRNALVADFGLSETIDGIRSKSALTTRGAGGARGTLRWMAPECLDEGTAPTRESDVYSLGLTIWEIFSGEIPFSSIPERLIVTQVVDRHKRPDRPSRLKSQDDIWELVQRCWGHEPASRPSVNAVLNGLEQYTTRLGSQALFFNRRSRPIRAADDIGQIPASMPAPMAPNTAQTPAKPKSAPSHLEQEWTKSLRSRPPKWTRGNPNKFIDVLTIPELPSEKPYNYRVVKGDTDLGIRPTYERDADGSQRINLLEYNKGYGIADTTSIKVYAVDPNEGEGEKEILVASWK